jgi:uncharacterized phage-associated protein
MYDARTVANEMIRLALDVRKPLNNIQIQKLVYIAHGFYLALSNQPLIKQPVEAGTYGPLIQDLYDALFEYGVEEITEILENVPREKLSDEARLIIRSVVNSYGRFSDLQLSTLTRVEDTPWKQVYDPNAFLYKRIANELIRDYYKKLLDERADYRAA